MKDYYFLKKCSYSQYFQREKKIKKKKPIDRDTLNAGRHPVKNVITIIIIVDRVHGERRTRVDFLVRFRPYRFTAVGWRVCSVHRVRPQRINSV